MNDGRLRQSLAKPVLTAVQLILPLDHSSFKLQQGSRVNESSGSNVKYIRNHPWINPGNEAAHSFPAEVWLKATPQPGSSGRSQGKDPFSRVYLRKTIMVDRSIPGMIYFECGCHDNAGLSRDFPRDGQIVRILLIAVVRSPCRRSLPEMRRSLSDEITEHRYGGDVRHCRTYRL